MRKVVAIFLFLLLFFVPQASRADGLPENFFCPSVKTNDGVCNPKCPEGYILKGNPQNGIYVCVPNSLNTPADIYHKCYYYDADCIKNPVEKVVSETFAKNLSQFWRQKEPLINTMIKVAAFDPEAINYFSKTELKPKFEFIVDVIKVLSEGFLTAFWQIFEIVVGGVTAVILAWLIPQKLNVTNRYVDSFTSYIEQKYADLRAPLVLGFRVLFGFALILTPVGVGTIDGQRVYITAIQKVVEKAALTGSDLANSLSHEITGYFFDFAGKELAKIAEDDLSIIRFALSEKSVELEGAQKTVENCMKVYGKVDLTQIPPKDLYKVPILGNEKFAKEKGLTRYYCRDAERLYKKTYSEYVFLYQQYLSGSDFKKWLEDNDLLVNIAKEADKLSKEDAFHLKIIKDEKKVALISMAIVAKTVRDYGWFALPVVLFPQVEVITANSDALEEIAKVVSSENPDPGLVAKMIATISFPPGSWIFNTLVDIGIPIAKAIGGIGGSLKGIPFLGGMLGGILEKLGTSIAVAGMATAIVVFTYLTASVLLKVLPVLFLGIVVSLRVFFWLVDVSKMILISPLAIVTALASHHAHRFWGFMANILIIGLYPVLILASALLAYFAAGMLADMAFYLPLKVIFDYLGRVGFFDVLRLGPLSIGGSIFGAIATATVYYLSFILKIVIIWTLGMNGPEKFLQLLRLQEFTPSTGEIREVAEQMKRPASPI